MALPVAGEQPRRARIREQPLQALGFGDRHTSSQSRQTVITPTLVVICWVWPLGKLLNEALLKQPLNRGVETAWTQPQCAIRAFRDILHHGIPMAIAVRQRDQDVKCVSVQGQKRFSGGLVGSYWSARHGRRLYQIVL